MNGPNSGWRPFDPCLDNYPSTKERAIVAGMCPYLVCGVAGQCMHEDACRLRPPLDEAAKKPERTRMCRGCGGTGLASDGSGRMAV